MKARFGWILIALVVLVVLAVWDCTTVMAAPDSDWDGTWSGIWGGHMETNVRMVVKEVAGEVSGTLSIKSGPGYPMKGTVRSGVLEVSDGSLVFKLRLVDRNTLDGYGKSPRHEGSVRLIRE